MNQREYPFLQQQAVMLTQAMLGVISPNFRMVSIEYVEDAIHVNVVLERESEEDREELKDCETEFEALQFEPIDFEFEVVIDSGDIYMSRPEASKIVTYRRREA